MRIALPLSCLLLSMSALAQQPAEDAPPTVPPATDPAPTPAPPPAATGPTPQRFTPSEAVRADFPVSFPSDI